MTRWIPAVLAALLPLLLSACAMVEPLLDGAAHPKAAEVATAPFPETDAWLLGNNMTVTAGRSATYDYDRAFAQGAVIAYGEGFPAAGIDHPGQKRLTAIRAAEVAAQRTLADFFQRRATGVDVRLTTGIVRLEALLRGAVPVVMEYNPTRAMAVVLLRLDLHGASGFVGPASAK